MRDARAPPPQSHLKGRETHRTQRHCVTSCFITLEYLTINKKKTKEKQPQHFILFVFVLSYAAITLRYSAVNFTLPQHNLDHADDEKGQQRETSTEDE